MLTIENLPEDVKDKLPEEVQRLYMAAYNSFLENSGDEAAATRVAWQTVERNEQYTRDSQGRWQRLDDEVGDDHRGSLGEMPQS
ncbi:MAG: ChaB family protein [Elainella sp.]